jgi:glycosyltransferase involved in cell wall biosynthesis
VIGKIHKGSYADACIREAERNDRIHIIEGLPNDSPLLESAYAACRVFALPSIFETPGIAALEAAVAGAGIVITPFGGTRDYFADEAIYVEPESTESIRSGLQRALAQGRPTGLGERIADEYAWERVAARTAEIYWEIKN